MGVLNIYDIRFAHNVSAWGVYIYIAPTRKRRMHKVIFQMATAGTESAVYDWLVDNVPVNHPVQR